MPLSRICPFREIWTLNVISQCDTKFSFILLSLSCTFVTSLLDGHNFPLPYFSFYLLTVCPQRQQRETGCLFTVTYIKVGKQAFQSQCVRHRRGPIGVQKKSKATEEGGSDGVGRGEEGGVIWSRLKQEQEGLVTEAYLRRRHRDSETVALWENLLQQGCWKGERSLRGRRGEETQGGKLRAAHGGEKTLKFGFSTKLGTCNS